MSWSTSFSWRSFKKGGADREAKRNRCVARRCWASANRWFQLSSSMNNFWWQCLDEMGLWPEVLQEVVGLVASPFHPPVITYLRVCVVTQLHSSSVYGPQVLIEAQKKLICLHPYHLLHAHRSLQISEANHTPLATRN